MHHMGHPTLWHSSNTRRPSNESPLSHSMTLGGRGRVTQRGVGAGAGKRAGTGVPTQRSALGKRACAAQLRGGSPPLPSCTLQPRHAACSPIAQGAAAGGQGSSTHWSSLLRPPLLALISVEYVLWRRCGPQVVHAWAVAVRRQSGRAAGPTQLQKAARCREARQQAARASETCVA